MRSHEKNRRLGFWENDRGWLARSKTKKTYRLSGQRSEKGKGEKGPWFRKRESRGVRGNLKGSNDGRGVGRGEK